MLHERGHFGWPECARRLAEGIAGARTRGGTHGGRPYYSKLLWARREPRGGRETAVRPPLLSLLAGRAREARGRQAHRPRRRTARAARCVGAGRAGDTARPADRASRAVTAAGRVPLCTKASAGR